MSNSVPETSLSADIFRYVRYQLRGRRGLIAAAVVLGIPALWFNWPWLVAIGVAPLIIALAPCAIMCAVGLCTMKSCSTSNPGEAGSCSKSQSDEQTVASVATSRLADETVEPMAIAVPPQANVNSLEDQSEAQPEHAGPLPGETINQKKEKLQ